VRLTNIDTLNLSLFEFDYDLTFMIFFLNADGKIYARYGGRDAEGADTRQSLAGLRYTMKSVLEMHARAQKTFAPTSGQAPRTVREVAGALGTGRCFHCHQAKEILIADLQNKGKWIQEMYWRYPLPENLGFELEVDRGNVVNKVKEKSPAGVAGLKKGDVVRHLNGVPIHPFGDAQYALDTAPRTGAIDIVRQRGDKVLKDKLALRAGWRKTDISWRPSLRYLIPSVRLWGADLTAEEKKALGLSPKQLAFRQKTVVAPQARAAGIRAGDIILGIDDERLETGVSEFVSYVPRFYLIGDKVRVNLIRDAKRHTLTMTFER
jgi:predicted metalloprotease with PDZ domain